MREPLNSFAERLIRTGELAEFLDGLVKEKGISRQSILAMIPERESARERSDEHFGPYGRGVSFGS